MIALHSFVLTGTVACDYNAVMKKNTTLKPRTVNFRMTEKELERLDLLARADDRSRSQVLRRLVMDGLDRAFPSKLIANG